MMRKVAGSAVAIFILCAPLFSQQEKISPLSEYQYNNTDSPRYQNIMKETDLNKRGDLLLAFLKERPISRILYNVVYDYLECIKPIIEKKDWAKAISMEEGLWTLLPTEKTIQDAGIPAGAEEPASAETFRKKQLQPAQALVQGSLFTVYRQSNNLPKAVEIGEKLYASTHDQAHLRELADIYLNMQNYAKAAEFFEKLYAANHNQAYLPVLAEIYLKMQNYEKYLDYGNKILAGSSIDKEYLMAIQLADIYFQKKQNESAAFDLYSKVVSAFGDKLPPTVPEVKYNGIRAFVYQKNANAANEKKEYAKARELYEKWALLDPKNNAIKISADLAGANAAYEKKEYAKAQEFYEKMLQIDPKNDVAYYYIALCKWRVKDSAEAIEPFAKCVALNKAMAKKAQEYLEQIYKARNNSLEGLDKVLAKAKADLGIK
jgi:tetratricopeptide (TPR) repeat protein